jgi:hypothetical protein
MKKDQVVAAIAAAFASFVTLTSEAPAQAPHADVPSAIAGGEAKIRLKGEPFAPYMLWFSALEEPTVVDGTLLMVDPFRALQEGLHIEGFLDANGLAAYTFPTGPEWDFSRISWQGVTVVGGGLEVSNLARATFQIPGTFHDAVGIPGAFSILGDAFAAADGRVIAIGGAGPVIEAYEPWTQDAIPAGIAQPNYLLSARAQCSDGRILVAGGMTFAAGTDEGGNPTLAIGATDEAYLYDPVAQSYTATAGKLIVARSGASATRLANGKIFIFGGLGAIDLQNPASIFSAILSSSEIFDPATGLFTAGPASLESKVFHSATLLNNGQVMLAGGIGTFFGIPTISNTAYFYNPATNSFGLLPKTFTGGRFFHSATKLADGRVLLAGGLSADLTDVIESGDLTQISFDTIGTTAIFNPSAGIGGSFAAGPQLLETRAAHTATLLDNATVLVAGGLSGTIDLGAILGGNFALPAALATSEIVSFNPNAVAPGPPMGAARAGASAIVSPMDGRVILIGGGPLLPELYQQ